MRILLCLLLTISAALAQQPNPIRHPVQVKLSVEYKNVRSEWFRDVPGTANHGAPRLPDLIARFGQPAQLRMIRECPLPGVRKETVPCGIMYLLTPTEKEGKIHVSGRNIMRYSTGFQTDAEGRLIPTSVSSFNTRVIYLNQLLENGKPQKINIGKGILFPETLILTATILDATGRPIKDWKP